ncbi:hypothetical protein SLE2022_246010 [Rubroshorea leprosula]
MAIAPNSSSFLIPCSSPIVVPSSSMTREKFQAEILAVTGASSSAQVNHPQLVPSITVAASGPSASQITHATSSVSGSWASVAKNSSKSLAEEAFLKQKSRVHWLQEGDQNTT